MQLRSKKILMTTIMVFALLCLALIGNVLSAYAAPSQPTFTSATVTVSTAGIVIGDVPINTTAWFAPYGTTSFTASSTMTKVYGTDGAAMTAATITAPANAGTYRLYFVEFGTTAPSTASTGILTTVPVLSTPSITSKVVAPGVVVTLTSAPPKGVTAWLAPANTAVTDLVASTTMTKLVGDGTKRTINAPKTVGDYYLYYANAVPLSTVSTGIITVKALPEKPVFTSAACTPGASVTLDLAIPANVYAWFAPATTKITTTTNENGTTITRAYGNDLLATITAPTKVGAYKLFYSNDAGVAVASVGTLTVVADLSIANPPEITAQEIAPGGTITLKTAPPKGITAWLAPANTEITDFIASTTMTKIAGTGSLKKIKAPKETGEYYLYYVNTVPQSVCSGDFITVVALPDKPVFTKATYTVSTEDASNPITLDSAVPTGVTAWFAPKGTKFGKFTVGKKMTSVDGDDSIDTLDAPMTVGTYQLFYVNTVGAVASAGTLTTVAELSIPELDEQEVKPGQKISLGVKPPKGVKAWLAPEGTELADFKNGTDMTSTTGKSIRAPKDEGTYYLYYVNAATSTVSESSITVAIPEEEE